MALTLTQAKKYSRMGGGAYKTIKPEFFSKGDRMEFPLEPTSEEIIKAVNESKVYKEVKTILNSIDYHFSPLEYAEGVASTPCVKHKLKIGKILQALRKTSLLEKFKEDFCRSYSGLKVVISRHPYDIASMTTNRGWPSCMDLVNGCNKNYVKRDVLGRTIIAYLTSMKDKNLTNPLARILLKRYENESGHEYYVPAKKAYGLSTTYFKPYLQRIADKINKNVPRGVYTLDQDYYYADENPEFIDTRLPEDIAAEKRKKLMRLVMEEVKAMSLFREEYDKLVYKIGEISILSYQDLLGTLKWKKAMKVITDDDYSNFVTSRTNLLDRGRSEYVKFIFDEISKRSTNNTDIIFTYWKFLSSFTLTFGALLEAASKFKQMNDHYYYIRTIDYPVGVSDNDREIYDVGEHLDHISYILESHSEYIEDNTQYFFQFLIECLTTRHSNYEETLLQFSKINKQLAQDLAYSYAYRAQNIRTLIEQDRNNDETALKIYNLAHNINNSNSIIQ